MDPPFELLVQRRPQVLVHDGRARVGDLAEIDGDASAGGHALGLHAQILSSSSRMVVVEAPQIHGEVEPARHLGDGVVLRIGMGLADGVDDVRSVLLPPETLTLHEAGEFHEREHGVAAEPARNAAGVAVGAVDSAVSVAQVAADPGDHAERKTRFEQHRTLLDMDLDVAVDVVGRSQAFPALRAPESNPSASMCSARLRTESERRIRS